MKLAIFGVYMMSACENAAREPFLRGVFSLVVRSITKSKREDRRFFQSSWYKSETLGIILNVG